MHVQDLIDRNYSSASVLEDLQQMAEWLQDRDYYAIVDEELKVAGILTINDFYAHQHRNQLVIDCDFSKPVICPTDSIQQILIQMLSSRNQYLPVFDNCSFVGVISIWALTQRLL